MRISLIFKLACLLIASMVLVIHLMRKTIERMRAGNSTPSN
jgi:hypothetical protein